MGLVLGIALFASGAVFLVLDTNEDSQLLRYVLGILFLVAASMVFYLSGEAHGFGKELHQSMLPVGNYQVIARIMPQTEGGDSLLAVVKRGNGQPLLVRFHRPVCQNALYIVQGDSLWRHPESPVDSTCSK